MKIKHLYFRSILGLPDLHDALDVVNRVPEMDESNGFKTRNQRIVGLSMNLPDYPAIKLCCAKLKPPNVRLQTTCSKIIKVKFIHISVLDV